MEPYLFEPEYADGESSSDSEGSDIEGNEDMDRVGNTFWCSCGLCSNMSRKENVCCQEWDILQDKLKQSGSDCVVNHSHFDKVCLDQVVLATCYVGFVRYKGIGGLAPDILNNRFV